VSDALSPPNGKSSVGNEYGQKSSIRLNAVVCGGKIGIRRAELSDSETSMTAANDLAVRRALELAGVEFIDENGGGPGVRLRNRQRPKQPK
jgi:hypothetical protein